MYVEPTRLRHAKARIRHPHAWGIKSSYKQDMAKSVAALVPRIHRPLACTFFAERELAWTRSKPWDTKDENKHANYDTCKHAQATQRGTNAQRGRRARPGKAAMPPFLQDMHGHTLEIVVVACNPVVIHVRSIFF